MLRGCRRLEYREPVRATLGALACCASLGEAQLCDARLLETLHLLRSFEGDAAAQIACANLVLTCEARHKDRGALLERRAFCELLSLVTNRSVDMEARAELCAALASVARHAPLALDQHEASTQSTWEVWHVKAIAALLNDVSLFPALGAAQLLKTAPFWDTRFCAHKYSPREAFFGEEE